MIVYGSQGQPLGTRDGDFTFAHDGQPIGYVHDNHIYKLSSGERVGSFGSGLVYNAEGKPVAFYSEKVMVLAPMAPRLSPRPPRLTPLGGQNVGGLAWKKIPDAVAGKLMPAKDW